MPILDKVIVETEKPITHAIIWLHGLGADGDDFVPIVPELILEGLGIRFIFPHAPVQPVTLNQGMKMRSWYDILGLDRTSQQDTEGIRSAERSILALIDEQIQQGIPSSKIFIAGFSQGGAMALHTGLRYPEKLAGIIALSTYLPLADLVEIERHSSNHETPIFYAHGHYDEILPEDFATSSCATLRTLDYFVELKLYPMGHTVCIEELKDLSAFIVKHAIKPLT